MLRVIIRSVNFSQAAHVGGPVGVELKTIDIAAPDVEAFLSEPERMHDHYRTREVIGVEALAAPPATEEPPTPAPDPDPPVVVQPPPVVVVEPPVVVAPPPVVVGKRVLTAADLYYKRSIQMPVELGNARGAFGVRHLEGQRRIVMLGSKNYDEAYEVDAATGALLTTLHPYGPTMNSIKNVQPTGACIDPRTDDLIFTFGDDYNVEQKDDPSYGVFSFRTGLITGPFWAHPNSHRTSGYPVPLPDGRIGFGAGLVSGNRSASWGAGLYDADGNKILGYDWPLGVCRRNPDYLVHPGGEGPQPDRAPEPGGGARSGHWTQDDMISGCAWIDLPDAHGLVFGGYQGHGSIWYGGNDDVPGVHDVWEGKGPHSERRVPMLWLYDPNNLNGDVFEEIALDGALTFGSPLPMITGMYFDAEPRELWLATQQADYSGDRRFAPTPLVHVLGIR